MARPTPPLTAVDWPEAWRIVPSRFPPVGPFDRIADPADLDALFAIEAMTNPRLRQEVGDLALVPAARRIAGPGSTPVMAAFTHPNPGGSRFADPGVGVFYAARSLDTAVRETMYHRARFMAATREPAMKIEMRAYRTAIRGQLHDLRAGAWPAELDPDDYRASQALAGRLRAGGADGIVYPSVRHAGGECVAVFYPDLVARCRQGRHLIYSWDGARIAEDYAVASLRSAPGDARD
ncbi:RES family NAD+ phosphorylase [Coralloluteibacterium stylophorae]|uniref:RES family NAD+ phosphorylase n=1 Tax=Coralloluteibacterium stylophorae TaxID=1776034 RepID=A0A8J8AY61_9GAMM|nr:RES family NAD+ phosphorylase [Coralloluteibacterium stylophorae]MBS7457407.1 RES family NAD+ phosphorylase [Coralloluteibacterium stylophorae]